MKKVFLSFDFYGAGNIGDDLMLEGFLDCFTDSDIGFHCCVPRNFLHQQYRFQKVKFADEKKRFEISKECKIWIGVGDTPVQVKSGDWFINKLESDLEKINRTNPEYYFAGIGAEKEAAERKDTFVKILFNVNHIWTRDKATSDILINDFEISPEKISTSSDLANISLSRIFRDSEDYKSRRYDLGFCYYDEKSEGEDLKNTGSFLKKFRKGKILLFGNEVNKKGNFEYALYEKMFGGINKYLYRNVKIYTPDYFAEVNTEELVRHYSECKTVMTSRYHALLTAAWAGCRVVSMERSSKVTALSEELGIKEIKKPFTPEKLKQGFEEAKVVDRNILLQMFRNASNSISELKKLIDNKL